MPTIAVFPPSGPARETAVSDVDNIKSMFRQAHRSQLLIIPNLLGKSDSYGWISLWFDEPRDGLPVNPHFPVVKGDLVLAAGVTSKHFTHLIDYDQALNEFEDVLLLLDVNRRRYNRYTELRNAMNKHRPKSLVEARRLMAPFHQDDSIDQGVLDQFLAYRSCFERHMQPLTTAPTRST